MTKEDVIYWFWFMTLVALMACGIMIIMAIDNDNQINKNKELTIKYNQAIQQTETIRQIGMDREVMARNEAEQNCRLGISLALDLLNELKSN